MVRGPDPDKPTIERLRLRSREIVAALLLTIAAAVVVVASMPGREWRWSTAAKPAADDGQQRGN
jgi:hypothetical protein